MTKRVTRNAEKKPPQAGRMPHSRLFELDETSFRRRVLVPLLSQVPDVRNVEDVHGRNEKGLDVIFHQRTALGSDLVFGLQLKAGSISGGAGTDKTVAKIVDQLNLAEGLRHPVAIENAGEVVIDNFVVACTGHISESARLEIASRRSDRGVQFWDGAKLLELVSAFMPQLLGHADAYVVAYLKNVIAKLNALDALDAVPGIAHRTLSQIHQEPHVRRRFDPSISDGDARGVVPASAPGYRLVDEKSSFVLVADQDAGKTALLRMLAIRTAERTLAQQETRQSLLPLCLQARDILARGTDALDAVVAALPDGNDESLRVRFTRDDGSLALSVFVDGFSELQSESDKTLISQAIEDLSADARISRIVVTGRPEDFLTPRHFKKFRHYAIEDFTKAQVASLLSRWTSESTPMADVAQRMVARIHEALQLPGSPVCATIGVMLYEKDRRLITNVAEAVDRYMVIRLGRYAHELGLVQQVDWARKEDILAEIAFQMLENGEVSLPRSVLVQRIDAIFARLGEDPLGEVVLHELVGAGVLDTIDDDICFHRVGFRDFFAAKAIDVRDDRDQLIESHLLDRRWSLVIVFAAGLRRKNDALIDRLSPIVERLQSACIGGPPSDDYFYAAFLLGRVLSNSELSSARQRLVALDRVLDASAHSVPEFAKQAQIQFGPIGEVAAVIGIEHTVFATVGVPWLAKQIQRRAAQEDELKAYLAASTAARLGTPGSLSALADFVQRADAPRILISASLLLKELRRRENSGIDEDLLESLNRKLQRKLATPARKKEVREIMQFKSKIVELEAKRFRRLMGSD